jgi:hypothetical protein
MRLHSLLSGCALDGSVSDYDHSDHYIKEWEQREWDFEEWRQIREDERRDRLSDFLPHRTRRSPDADRQAKREGEGGETPSNREAESSEG